MASTNVTAIGKRIKDNDIDRVYYFYGHDVASLERFAKALINKLCPGDAQFMNLHKFEGKNFEIGAFSDACEALPMFAERVVVAINDLNMETLPKSDGDDLRKILKGLSDTTTVIIYATGVDLYKNKRYLSDKNKRFADFCEKLGSVCEFAYKRASDLARSIASALSKKGCQITKPNAEYLANMCLCDSAFIAHEIDKLSAYAQGREITRADIDLLCIKRIESDGYSLALNVLQSNAGFVFNRLRELSAQNFEAFEILNIISFSMTDIYRAKLARSSGLTVSDVVKDFGYPRNREFAVKNAYSECANFSVRKIREILEILSQTDLMLKTQSKGNAGDMLMLEQCLARSMALRC